MEFSKELIDKVKACQTAEELLALAKENEIELTKEDAETLICDFREGELADDELDNVSGGAEGCKPPNTYDNIYWNNQEDVQFIFNIGDQVEALALGCKHHTATCKVTDRKSEKIYVAVVKEFCRIPLGWADLYYLEKMSGVKSAFVDGWYQRNRIEK